MNDLRPDEYLLIGRWIDDAGTLKADSVCERIEWLIAHRLKRLADSPEWGGWETLYQDSNDGRYWERTYPQSDLHGGGPPKLQVLSATAAAQKYRLT